MKINYLSKRKIIIVAVVLLIIITAVRFNPLTPKGALRCELVAEGHPFCAVIMKTKPVNTSSKAYHMQDNQQIYKITIGIPYEKDTATKLNTWLIEKNKLGYKCSYYGC